MKLLGFFVLLFVSLLLGNTSSFSAGGTDELTESSHAPSSSAPTHPALPEPVRTWVESMEQGTEVERFSFGPKLIAIIKNREANPALYERVIAQLSAKVESSRLDADGGYGVEYYPDLKSVYFNSYGGSKAK